jgi:hypothetical protein
VLIVRVFDIFELPVPATAKRAGDVVVVLLRQDLCPRCRRRLVKQLLTPEELSACNDIRWV